MKLYAFDKLNKIKKIRNTGFVYCVDYHNGKAKIGSTNLHVIDIGYYHLTLLDMATIHWVIYGYRRGVQTIKIQRNSCMKYLQIKEFLILNYLNQISIHLVRLKKN